MIALFTVVAIPFDIILSHPQSIFNLGMFEQDETVLGFLKFPFPYLEVGKNAIL